MSEEKKYISKIIIATQEEPKEEEYDVKDAEVREAIETLKEALK